MDDYSTPVSSIENTKRETKENTKEIAPWYQHKNKFNSIYK